MTDAQHALELANDSEFGLAAGVWTSDIGEALALARDLQVGQVFVNNYGSGGGVELPFGGWKGSGFGREKGVEALASYSQRRTSARSWRAPRPLRSATRRPAPRGPAAAAWMSAMRST